jgi:hypothetical protein
LQILFDKCFDLVKLELVFGILLIHAACGACDSFGLEDTAASARSLGRLKLLILVKVEISDILFI